MKSPARMEAVVSRTAGDAQAPPFSECVSAFGEEFEYVCRALRRHGVHRGDAEDLAQDVFLVVWRRWSSYDPSRPLRPWLAGIAARVAHDFHKRRRREVPHRQVDLEDPALVGEEHVEAARARGLVLAALARLPERHRLALVRHELEGVPPHELARLMNVPLSTAYTRIRRARLAFARVLAGLEKKKAAPPTRGKRRSLSGMASGLGVTFVAAATVVLSIPGVAAVCDLAG